MIGGIIIIFFLIIYLLYHAYLRLFDPFWSRLPVVHSYDLWTTSKYVVPQWIPSSVNTVEICQECGYDIPVYLTSLGDDENILSFPVHFGRRRFYVHKVSGETKKHLTLFNIHLYNISKSSPIFVPGIISTSNPRVLSFFEWDTRVLLQGDYVTALPAGYKLVNIHVQNIQYALDVIRGENSLLPPISNLLHRIKTGETSGFMLILDSLVCAMYLVDGNTVIGAVNLTTNALFVVGFENVLRMCSALYIENIGDCKYLPSGRIVKQNRMAYLNAPGEKPVDPTKIQLFICLAPSFST